MIIMILDTIFSLLINPSLCLIHSSMVFSPLLPKYFSFNVNLILQIISQLIELILEFLLKLVNNIMNMIHAVDGIFPIFSNFCVSIIEFLFHLSFVLYTSVLEDLESSTHVLHLRLQFRQVFILSWVFFYHF